VLSETKEEAEETARQEIVEKVYEAFKTRGTRHGFESKKLKNKKVTEEPVLEDQLDKKEKQTTKEYAEELVEKNTKTKEVTGDDGQKRYVTYVDFSLAEDYLEKRARKVEDDVYKYAKMYNLDPALVFAIIHTESYYNPTAVSPVNAYGLMQIVPSSGGRDAYRKIFKKDGIPTKEYLFRPEKNIQMGAAFIQLMGDRYFDGVSSETTKSYMVISAYNTGAGNVANAYSGKMVLSGAIREANKMNDQENFKFLRKNLEYEEARNYLKKVTDQRKIYSSWKRSTASVQ
jgi:membrane-bound lytic murein transglycosylase C